MSMDDLLGVGNYRGDPDYIITVDGKPIPTDDIIQWAVVDDEETASSIVVELENHDYRYSGKAKIGSKLCIRFGYVGFLVGKAEFPIMAFKEHYGENGVTVTLTGKDPTQKSGGNKQSGKMGDSPKAAVQAAADPIFKDPNGGGSGNVEIGGKFPDKLIGERKSHKLPIFAMNETQKQFFDKMLPFNSSEKEAMAGVKAAGDVMPTEPSTPQGFKGESSKGDTQSGTGNANNDKNRGKHGGGKGGQDPVTAQIQLIGYPELKAKKTITIENLGSAASGTYYVKQCKHHVKRGGGDYRTEGSLIRGGTGKGGAAPTTGLAPCVMYANIYGQGGYIGPRKYEDKTQDILVYGRGGPIIGFTLNVSPQPNRGGGGGQGKSRGHDISNRAKPKDSIFDDPNKQATPQNELEQRGTE